jgi:hypothetical protein
MQVKGKTIFLKTFFRNIPAGLFPLCLEVIWNCQAHSKWSPQEKSYKHGPDWGLANVQSWELFWGLPIDSLYVCLLISAQPHCPNIGPIKH